MFALRNSLVGMIASATTVALGACAAMQPGYVPEGSKRAGFERVKPFDAGTVAANGAYVPSEAERALDCKRLKGSILVVIAKLRGPQSAAPSSTAAAAQGAMATIRGRVIIMEPTEEAKRERARIDAFNKLLAEKQCPTVDIEGEMTKPAAAAVPPKSKS